MELRRIKLFFSQTPFWQLLVACFILVAGSAVAYGTLIPQTDKLLILHYSIPFGIDRIGEWHELFYMLVFGFGVFLCNMVIAFFTFVKQRLFAQLILLFTLLLECVIASGVGLLIYQNY